MLHLTTTIPEREAIAALTRQLEQAAVIKGQRAHFLARKMLAADVGAHEYFLAHVEAVYGGAVAKRLHDAFWLAALERLVATEKQESTTHG